MKEAVVTYRVPYADTDQMGVVYYANYLVMFERGRNELMRSMGLTYQEMESRGLGLPVLEAHCDYKSPARYDDLLEIRSYVTKMEGLKLKVCCEITRNGEILALGYTIHVCLDLERRRPARAPQWFLNLFD